MSSMVRRPSQFRDYALSIKNAVDRELSLWIAPRTARAKELGGATSALAEAIAQFATRGGKRLRAVLLALAYEAYAGAGANPHPKGEGAPGPRPAKATGSLPSGLDDILPALLSVELLQAYLLIHDDWMDEDDVRRGGPTVHVMLREHFGAPRLGEIGAILAGDLTAGYALEALGETRTSPDRLAGAMRELARIQVDVVLGQTLDVYKSEDLESMHELKTNSYTVRGPLLLGATLGGASAAQKAELEAFARPLGLAFQLRDDLLGTFGDPEKTGKSCAGDLRQGKRTALIHELLAGDASGEDRALVTRVLGVSGAPSGDIERVVERFTSSGAKARVESKLHALLEDAQARLARMVLAPEAQAILAGAVSALGEREQ